MNSQEWAFVDLENIGSLENISLKNYAAVYVFVGANQSKLSLIPLATETFTEIKVLKIKSSSKNNLDFHLSYYLGKLDANTEKKVSFTVISNDTGFDNLLEHINNTGRKCSRLKIEKEEEIVTKELLLNLLNKDIEKTPKSEKSLKNYIKSHLGNNNSPKNIDTTFKAIIKNRKIAKRLNKIS